MITSELSSVFAKIQEAAEAAVNDTIVIKDIAPGKGVRQGDVYLVRADTLQFDKRRTSNQVAEGTSIGARHIVVGAEVFERATNERIPVGFGNCIFGPVIKAESRFELTHPEHANYDLPAGNYFVAYQTDPRTRQAVMD